VRKGTDIPYITHPLEVMQILGKVDCETDVVIAGLLHDTLEDTDTTPEEIQKLFGKKVLQYVQSESEDKSKSWMERKQNTIDTLENAPFETKLICCADKLSNLRSIYIDWQEIRDNVWERFNAPKKLIQWYYKNIGDILMKSLYKLDMCHELAHLVDLIFFQEEKRGKKTENLEESILQEKYTFEDYLCWDDELYTAANDFNKKHGLYPNIMLACSATYDEIDKEIKEYGMENLSYEGSDNNEEPPEFDSLATFTTDDFSIDFCLKPELPSKTFILIYDDSPEFDGEEIDEQAGHTPKHNAFSSRKRKYQRYKLAA
jgi:hypothetical protein